MPTQEDLAERAARVLGTDHPGAGSLRGDHAEAILRALSGDMKAAELAEAITLTGEQRFITACAKSIGRWPGGSQ